MILDRLNLAAVALALTLGIYLGAHTQAGDVLDQAIQTAFALLPGGGGRF